MRVVTAVLLAAIVGVLSVIAIDLHRVARSLEPAGALSAGVLSLGTASAETREQRVERNLRELRAFRAELDATIEAQRRLDTSRR